MFGNALAVTLTYLKSAEFFPPQSALLDIAGARNVSERTVTNNILKTKKELTKK